MHSGSVGEYKANVNYGLFSDRQNRVALQTIEEGERGSYAKSADAHPGAPGAGSMADR